MSDEMLLDRLLCMANDMQISGDSNFRGMANALKLRGEGLLAKERKHMERMLRRAEKLLESLSNFWASNPVLDELIDRGEVCATDGLQYAERKMDKAK